MLKLDWPVSQLMMERRDFMNRSFLIITAAPLAAAIALAGCAAAPGAGGYSPEITNSSAETDHSTPPASEYTAAASGAPDAAVHNAADAVFAQAMIPHHAQAVEMSGVVLAKREMPAAVRSLAERIRSAQAREIEVMTRWLRDWSEPVPGTGMSAGGSGGSGMTGMISEDALDKLRASAGAAAGRLFLTLMIAHHEAAVTMAETEDENGSNAGAIKLSQGIAASRQAEIQEMRTLLASL